MRQKSNSTPASSETLLRNIPRATRKHRAAEEKIRIVLDGLRGETSIAELCRREGIAERLLVRPDLCHYFQNSQHTAADLPTPPALWINKGFNNYSAEKVIAIAAEAALEIADAAAGIARSWVTSARSFLRISMFQSRSRRRI